MSGDVHAGFCERRGVRFPPATLLVVMVSGTKTHAHAIKDEVAAVLSTMGLRLSQEKTGVVHIDEGLDFLGWRIQRQTRRGMTDRYVYTYPSKKALRAVMEKVPCVARDRFDVALEPDPAWLNIGRSRGDPRPNPPRQARPHRPLGRRRRPRAAGWRGDRHNEHWLLERHGYRTPRQAREALRQAAVT